MGATLLLFSNLDDEDYIPISEILSFAVVTGDRQCINISVINDTVLEDDEVFLIQSINTSLITPIPSTVPVVVLNDDGKWLNDV